MNCLTKKIAPILVVQENGNLFISLATLASVEFLISVIFLFSIAFQNFIVSLSTFSIVIGHMYVSSDLFDHVLSLPKYLSVLLTICQLNYFHSVLTDVLILFLPYRSFNSLQLNSVIFFLHCLGIAGGSVQILKVLPTDYRTWFFLHITFLNDFNLVCHSLT